MSSFIRYSINHIPASPSRLVNYKDGLVFVGSCFSEHIANRLIDFEFNVQNSPNGIVYNPISLADAFLRISENRDYVQNDLIHHNGYWHSKFHHGSFSDLHVHDTLHGMNNNLHAFRDALKKAKFLFVSFGSAIVYTWKEDGNVVANCHKIPQQKFEKRLLSVNEISDTWRHVIEILKQLNPHLQIVFTVSPVKHLKDGVEQNQISKSILMLALYELKNRNPDLNYFPAYELVTDDLRDYRFYETDGAHPNTMAIDYVFDKFSAAYFDSETKSFFIEMQEYKLMNSQRL